MGGELPALVDPIPAGLELSLDAAEEMYAPETFGRTASERFVVEAEAR